jgi:hypothetical protein
LTANPHADLKVYVVWGTVLPDDRDPPTDSVSALITDPRVEQFWDPNHDVSVLVHAAADSGMKAFSEFKAGGHTPYDMANLYKPGTKWTAKIPEPIYVGVPVGTTIPELKKQLAGIGIAMAK